jgi:hypothetical protein
MRLRQVQCAKVWLQIQPYRFPVLRRRLHYHFLHFSFLQPSHQMLAFTGGGSKAAAGKSEFFHCHLRYHHHQYLLMNVDSCYCVGHCFLSGGEAAERTTNLGITHPYVLMPFLFGRTMSH